MKSKKIVFHVTRQYMLKNKKRTITTVFGIMFMVVMMTCVFIGKDTAISYLTQIAESKSGSWHMIAYDVDREQYEQLKEQDFISETAFTYDMGFTECVESKNESKPFFEIKGYSDKCFDWMNISLVEGRYPENESEIIVSTNALGDGAELLIGDRIHAKPFYRSIKGINPDAEQTTFPYQQLSVSYGQVVEVPQDFPYYGENDSFEELHIYTGKEEEYEIVGFMNAPSHETDGGSFYSALTWVPDGEEIYKYKRAASEQVNLVCKFDLKKYEDTDYLIVNSILQKNGEEENAGKDVDKTTTSVSPVEKTDNLENVDQTNETDQTIEVDQMIEADQIDEADRTDQEDNGARADAVDEADQTDASNQVEETEYVNYDYSRIEINDLVLTFSGDSSESDINEIANVMVVFFVIFILMVSVILIYNVFNISFEERRRYLGMLASVGATRKQKKSSIYYEAFILLAIAMPIGIALGLAVVKAGMLLLQPYILKMMNYIVAETVNNESVRLVISPVNVLLVVGSSVLTVLISAVLPAGKIAKIGPIESIRGNDGRKGGNAKTNPHLMKKGKAEVLLSLRNLARQRRKTGSIIRAIAVFLIVLMVTTYGTSAVTQMVHYRLVEDSTISFNLKGYDYELVEMQGYGGTYGRIKNEIVNDPDLLETKEWKLNMFGGSIDGRCLNENYWNAYRAIMREYLGSELSDEECMKYVPDDNGRIYTTLSIVGVDNETFLDIAEKSGCQKELIDGSEYPAIMYNNVSLTTDNIGIQNKRAAHYRVFELDSICDMEPGSTLEAEMYSARDDEVKTVSFTLAGYGSKESVSDYLSFNGEEIWIIVNEDVAERLDQLTSEQENLDIDGNYNGMDRTLFVKLKSSDCALAKKLDDLSTRETEEYILMSPNSIEYDLENISEAISYAIRILAICFVVFAGLICLLNLYNSIRGRAVMRKRDIAMLRSIGMEERQLDRMLLLENAGMWLVGLLWSLIFSMPITYGISHFLIGYFGVMNIRFPWTLYLLAAFITIISLLLISKMCYHMRENEILLEEMRQV